MAVKQIYKRIKKVNPPQKVKIVPVEIKEEIKEDKIEDDAIIENKKTKKNKTMKLEEIAKAEELVNDINKSNVKIIKKDRGLIERTEAKKVILTEDNRQVLTD